MKHLAVLAGLLGTTSALLSAGVHGAAPAAQTSAPAQQPPPGGRSDQFNTNGVGNECPGGVRQEERVAREEQATGTTHVYITVEDHRRVKDYERRVMNDTGAVVHVFERCGSNCSQTSVVCYYKPENQVLVAQLLEGSTNTDEFRTGTGQNQGDDEYKYPEFIPQRPRTGRSEPRRRTPLNAGTSARQKPAKTLASRGRTPVRFTLNLTEWYPEQHPIDFNYAPPFYYNDAPRSMLPAKGNRNFIKANVKLVRVEGRPAMSISNLSVYKRNAAGYATPWSVPGTFTVFVALP
ncbi:MAG: hypothetical protein U0Q12_20535 [Vicinamibacterales bacterium]